MCFIQVYGIIFLMLRLRDFRILDFFVFLAILLIGGVSIITVPKNSTDDTLLVNANGTEYRYSLSRNGTYSVEGALGTTTFEIRDSRVRIIDSPCPNKTCIEQAYSNPIVCLPNRVMLTIQKSGGDFDAISE